MLEYLILNLKKGLILGLLDAFKTGALGCIWAIIIIVSDKKNKPAECGNSCSGKTSTEHMEINCSASEQFQNNIGNGNLTIQSRNEEITERLSSAAVTGFVEGATSGAIARNVVSGINVPQTALETGVAVAVLEVINESKKIKNEADQETRINNNAGGE